MRGLLAWMHAQMVVETSQVMAPKYRATRNLSANRGGEAVDPVRCAACGKKIADPPPKDTGWFKAEPVETCSFACAMEVLGAEDAPDGG